MSVKLKNIVFSFISSGKKKFKKRAINETKITPNMDIVSTSFVWNLFRVLLFLYENKYP